MSVRVSNENIRRLADARSRNLRQLLNRAMRALNAIVQDELVRRGYENIRLAHNMLLINFDFEGNSITAVAERAKVTKQAMGLLAEELEKMGYITRLVDENDARARVLMLTDKGQRLMLDIKGTSRCESSKRGGSVLLVSHVDDCFAGAGIRA